MLAVALVATAWMTWTAWMHRRRRHVIRLGVLNALAFTWVLTALLYHILDAAGPRHVLLDLRYVPVSLIPVAWLGFSWAASGLPRLSLRSFAVILAVPVMTLFLLATNNMHGLLFSGLYEVPNRWGVIVGHEFGPWFWVHTAYSYALFATGAALIGVMLVRSHPVLRPKVALLLIGALAPAVINVLYLTNEALFGFVDPSPVGFAISTLCYGACVFRFRILEMTPVPAGQIVHSLDEARVVLTHSGRVLDLNPAAEVLFETRASELVGGHASGVIRSLWRRRGETGVIEDVEITEVSNGGWFELALTPIGQAEGESGEPACWLLRLRDIAERKALQFELESRIAGKSSEAARQAAALETIHYDLTPRLAGVRGLAGAVAEDVDGESAGFARLIEEGAAAMEETLLRQLDAAEGLSTGADSELPKRPSRAPVRRSGAGPRASGTPAEDPIR